MLNNAVDVEGLRVIRGDNLVLPGLDLSIRHGAITGLLGPSGSGKTTLIRCIAGVQIVEAGTVTVLGDAAGTAKNRARVGYVTQASSVYPDLTVRQNLEYFAALYGSSGVDGAMSDVGLDPVLRRDLWDVFAGLAEAGRTLLVSSHVMDEAGRCDDVILMREGQLLAQLTPDELLASTGADDLEAAFLAMAEGRAA